MGDKEREPPGRIEQAIVAYAWRAGGGAPLGMPDREGMRVNDSLFTPTATEHLLVRLVPVPYKVSCMDDALAFVAHVMVRHGPMMFHAGSPPWSDEMWDLRLQAAWLLQEHVMYSLAQSLLTELFM